MKKAGGDTGLFLFRGACCNRRSGELGGKPLTAVHTLAGALAICCLGSVAGGAALEGVDADREEVRLEREFPRAELAQDYLSQLARRIMAASPNPLTTQLRIHALRADQPFAFGLGNGALFVSTGLLARLENDSQVACLVGPEITASLAPNEKLEAEFVAWDKRHKKVRLLAVLATGGIAVFPILGMEIDKYADQAAALIADNDRTAVDWLRRAGFDVAQCPLAPRRLQDTLAAEQQFGVARLASAEGLQRRGEQLQLAVEQSPAATASTIRSAEDSAELRMLAHTLSLKLARDYKGDERRASFKPLIDRIEGEFGVNGASICLRAEYLGEMPASQRTRAEVIEAYRNCVAAPDSPPQYLRELAFLHRDAGDAPSAIHAFERYLERAPDAVDAPIIRITIEDLHAQPQ